MGFISKSSTQDSNKRNQRLKNRNKGGQIANQNLSKKPQEFSTSKEEAKERGPISESKPRFNINESTNVKKQAVQGASKKDAAKLVEDLHLIFHKSDFDRFRGLIKRTGKKGKGKKISPIKVSDVEEAFKDIKLDVDQIALVEMVVNTINSSAVHKVEYKSDASDLLSSSAQKSFKNKLPYYIDVDKEIEMHGGIRSGTAVGNLGGAGTVSNKKGSNSVLIEKRIKTRREVTTGHELFGHGRSYYAGRKSAQQQHEAAVKTENLILRVMGLEDQQIDGSEHANGALIEKPKELPAFR